MNINNGKVYYPNEEGIWRMNLDCTGLENISDASTVHMDVYRGTLYYIGSEKGMLYRLNADGISDVVDETQNLDYLDIEGSELKYGVSYDGADHKSIDLSGYDPSEEKDQYNWFSAASVPKSRSFAVNIKFSEAMDTARDWFDTIIMTDPNGNRIDTHLIWSEDGKTLTVRPRKFIGDFPSVSVYIAKDARSAAGAAMGQGRAMRIDINADADTTVG
jgi:hypothetical protein